MGHTSGGRGGGGRHAARGGTSGALPARLPAEWHCRLPRGAPPPQLCNNTFDEIYLQGNNFTCGAMPCFHCAYCSKGKDQLLPCAQACQPC